MRTDQEMLNLIMSVAENDDGIRAVTLNGSRASKTATKDKYCDFDVVYVVDDVRNYTKDKSWVNCFGDILIVQHSMDWYSHPYDYNSRDRFIYLIQFADGHRIDLSIVDLTHVHEVIETKEPQIILMNKDNIEGLKDSHDESIYHIKVPTEHELLNTSNEFRWLSLYVMKGLKREELYYAKYAYDVMLMEMFIKMLQWDVGIKHDFSVTLGSHKKYFKRFLDEPSMKRLHRIFPNGRYEDIWDKLFEMYDYFHELETVVWTHFGLCVDAKERSRVKAFLELHRKS